MLPGTRVHGPLPRAVPGRTQVDRKVPGVTPTRRRKVRVSWACSATPHGKATSASGRSARKASKIGASTAAGNGVPGPPAASGVSWPSTVAQQWDTQKLMSAAGAGQLPKDAFPAAAMNLVAPRITAKCDALDGLADGMVQDRVACQAAFSLAADVPTCTGAAAATCLTPAQKTALQKVFDGGRNAADPVFSFNDTLAWYDALKAADANAPDYAQVFLVPGMNHCSGGPATPTRPPCAYPTQALLKAGAADTETASSVECRQRRRVCGGGAVHRSI